MASTTQVRHEFDNTLYVVPSTIAPGQKDVRVEWLYRDIDKNEIEHVQAGCTCTAEFEIGDRSLVAKYTDDTTKEQLDSFVSKRRVVEKNVRVFFKDGKPLKVMGDRGVMQWNPDKSFVILRFVVTVA